MANKNTLLKKQQVIDEISDKIKTSASIILFEYHGLGVLQMMELRRKLRENNADLKIYKNTLTKRALEQLNYDLHEDMVGPKAIAFGNDAIMPIKILSEYAKKNKQLEIKVGIVDSNITRIESLNQLASIPSREGLLTMLAGGLIGTVKDLSVCLDLYSQNK
ncbi:MAG: 50S ribosomal protein L10 [Bacilli bacterium]